MFVQIKTFFIDLSGLIYFSLCENVILRQQRNNICL
jgi:hypothetical protein